tara:strand:- start:101 stop:337 length:237 start_codon:yes stop_codon:yes gene_type:complete
LFYTIIYIAPINRVYIIARMTASEIITRAGGIKAVASFLGLTEDQIRKWRQCGHIPAKWHSKLAEKTRIARRVFDALL